MSVSLSILARDDAGDAIVDLIDTGSVQANGYLEIRTGSKPASPQAAVTGTLLAICGFSRPAFGNFSNGQAVANPIAQDTDIADNGVAGWFRVYNRDGEAIFDGEIGLTDSGKDIEFDSINFIKGGTVAITALTANMPQ